MKDRYYIVESSVNKEKKLFHKDGNNTHAKSTSSFPEKEIGDCIHVRSHEIGAQAGRDASGAVKHMVTVKRSTRLLWKKEASQHDLRRQACAERAFLESSGHLKKQEKSLFRTWSTRLQNRNSGSKERFPSSQTPSDTRYKRIPLQPRNHAKLLGSPLITTASLPKLKGIHSLNRSRERVREGRVSLLKACKNDIFKDRGELEEKYDRQDSSKINHAGKGVESTFQTENMFQDRSLWRKFTTTLMRRGLRVRSQTMLSKALRYLRKSIEK